MRVSPNFTAAELGNPPAHLYGNMAQLADALETVRARVKRPIHVNSGYRDPAKNSQVGGSNTSAHMWAHAADFHVEGLTPKRLAKEAEASLRAAGIKWDQIIIYQSHVHLGLGSRQREQVFAA